MKRHIKNLAMANALMVLTAFTAVADDSLPTLNITKFEIISDSKFTLTGSDALLARFVGKNRQLSDIQDAIQSLEDFYHSQGYSLTKIVLPEQELNSGIVKLFITQPRISAIKISGNKTHGADNVRNSVPALRENTNPNLQSISSSLRLANENPSKKTTLSLEQTKSIDQINATLEVVDQSPLQLGLSIDNAGSEKTGRTQLTTALTHSNVADLDHILSVQYITSLEYSNRVSTYGAGYHIPFYSSGDSLDLYANHSETSAEKFTLGSVNLNIGGKGSSIGIKYNLNTGGSNGVNSRLIFGIDRKIFQNDVSYQGFPLGNEVDANPVNLTFTADWSQQESSTGLYASIVKNISTGDHAGSLDFERVRLGATADYSYLRYGINHLSLLPRNWKVRIGLNGQVSQDALIPGEQFAAGGAYSVRGYTERAISDDQGINFNLELHAPEFLYGDEYRVGLLTFFDIAHTKRNNPLPSEQTDSSISSAGFGARFVMGRSFSAQIDVGQALRDGGGQTKGDSRMHFKMSYLY